MITGRERPTFESIWESLTEKGFAVAQLMPNILINTMIYGEEKCNKAMSKLQV